MIEQKIQTHLTKPAKVKYEHQAGTPVTKVDHYFDKKNNERVLFVAPKIDGLYFKRAEQLFKETIKEKKEVITSKGAVNPKDASQGNVFINETAVFNFFSIASAGIILLFSSVEANVNNAIERYKNINYVVQKDKIIIKLGKLAIRYKKSIKLSKEEILFLDIKTKLKKVLPKIYNFDFPAEQNFWQHFIELKQLRDGLIHSSISKSYGANNNKNSIYAELLDIDFDKLLKCIEDFITFLDDKVSEYNRNSPPAPSPRQKN